MFLFLTLHSLVGCRRLAVDTKDTCEQCTVTSISCFICTNRNHISAV